MFLDYRWHEVIKLWSSIFLIQLLETGIAVLLRVTLNRRACPFFGPTLALVLLVGRFASLTALDHELTIVIMVDVGLLFLLNVFYCI